jgi:hypothetical protein
MMSNFQNRIQQTNFRSWLAEQIYYDGMCYASRSQVILTFIRDLRNFISSKGYSFRADDIQMARAWARYLFLYQTRSTMKGLQFTKNFLGRPEDYTMYCDIFDSEKREPFEEMLVQIQDFDSSTYKGSQAIAAVFPFAWHYIDISNSSATEIVDDMLDGSDSEGEYEKFKPRVRKDPYLVDLANAASKYNRWD